MSSMVKIKELKKQLVIARSTISIEFAKKMFEEIGYGSGELVSQHRIQKFIKDNTDDGTHSFIAKEEVEGIKEKVLEEFNTVLNKYGE